MAQEKLKKAQRLLEQATNLAKAEINNKQLDQLIDDINVFTTYPDQIDQDINYWSYHFDLEDAHKGLNSVLRDLREIKETKPRQDNIAVPLNVNLLRETKDRKQFVVDLSQSLDTNIQTTQSQQELEDNRLALQIHEEQARELKGQSANPQTDVNVVVTQSYPQIDPYVQQVSQFLEDELLAKQLQDEEDRVAKISAVQQKSAVSLPVNSVVNVVNAPDQLFDTVLKHKEPERLTAEEQKSYDRNIQNQFAQLSSQDKFLSYENQFVGLVSKDVLSPGQKLASLQKDENVVKELLKSVEQLKDGVDPKNNFYAETDSLQFGLEQLKDALSRKIQELTPSSANNVNGFFAANKSSVNNELTVNNFQPATLDSTSR